MNKAPPIPKFLFVSVRVVNEHLRIKKHNSISFKAYYSKILRVLRFLKSFKHICNDNVDKQLLTNVLVRDKSTNRLKAVYKIKCSDWQKS